MWLESTQLTKRAHTGKSPCHHVEPFLAGGRRALPGEPAGSRALHFFLLVGAEGVALCSLLSALGVALCLRTGFLFAPSSVLSLLSRAWSQWRSRLTASPRW